MMTEVRCHGSLALLPGLGCPIRLDVATMREVFYALDMQVPGFRGAINDGPGWHILSGSVPLTDHDMIDLPPGARLDIVPSIEGAGGNAATYGLIALGVVMIGASIWTGGATGAAYLGAVGITGTAATAVSTVAFGIGMALLSTGISTLMAADPKATESSTGSTLMGGDVNVTESGRPIPIICGEILVGSIVASGGISTIQVGT